MKSQLLLLCAWPCASECFVCFIFFNLHKINGELGTSSTVLCKDLQEKAEQSQESSWGNYNSQALTLCSRPYPNSQCFWGEKLCLEEAKCYTSCMAPSPWSLSADVLLSF